MEWTLHSFERAFIFSMIFNLSPLNSCQSAVVGTVYREFWAIVVVCVCDVLIGALVVTLLTFVRTQQALCFKVDLYKVNIIIRMHTMSYVAILDLSTEEVQVWSLFCVKNQNFDLECEI